MADCGICGWPRARQDGSCPRCAGGSGLVTSEAEERRALPAEPSEHWPWTSQDPPDEEETEVRAVRRPGRGAVLHLATLFPLALASFLVVAPLAYIVRGTLGGGVLIALVVVWWLPMPLLLARPAAPLLARLKGHREPTSQEAARLAGPWASLLRKASIPGERYLLLVSDAEEAELEPCDGFTSGFPASGYVVAVPAATVARLQSRELEAVLAHNLAHHLGMHPVTRLLAYELWLPLLLLEIAIRLFMASVIVAYNVNAFLSRVAYAIYKPSSWIFTITLFFGGVVLLGYLFFLAHWLLLTFALFLTAVGLGRLVRYTQEYEADQTVAGLGLGSSLLAVLESALRSPRPDQPRYERLLKLRPLAVRRTERLQALLAGTGPAVTGG